MYHQYENSYELEERLYELEAIKRRMIEEMRYDMNMEISEIEDRIQFENENWQA